MNSKVVVIIFMLTLLSLVVASVTAVIGENRFQEVEKRLTTLTAEVNTSSQVSPLPSTPTETPLATASTVLSNVDKADVQQLKQTVVTLKESLSDVEERLKKLEKATPAPKTTTQPREYIIFLGSGSTTNRDWTVIPAAGVTLDISQYKNVRSIVFEAGLSIINGEAHARLYDSTTSQPFYTTEVFDNTSAGVWKTSPTFPLSAGNHYYTVQLRSSSGETANLVGARLKIVAD